MTFLTSFFIAQSDTVNKVIQKEDDWIMHHVSDHVVIPIPPVTIGGFTIDLSITNKVLMLIIAAGILIITLSYAGLSNRKRKTPTGFGNFVEILMLFVKEDIIEPTMGHNSLPYLPFFFTMFFFILTVNFLGLVPAFATGTSSVSVTAGLALITFAMTQLLGIKNNGLGGYLKGLIPPGIPIYVLPIMIVVEFISLLTKPFALCIRLFANMIAGHIVIYVFIGLIFAFGYAVIPVSVAFALFIYLLEILICLLQAYIFTMLSSLFIGMAIHQEH